MGKKIIVLLFWTVNGADFSEIVVGMTAVLAQVRYLSSSSRNKSLPSSRMSRYAS